MITTPLVTAAIWVCIARSVTGKVYYGNDAEQAIATEKAMEACQKESFRCFLESCAVTTTDDSDSELSE